MLVPIGAEHLKAAYLRRASDMLADTRANIVVTYPYQSDGLRDVLGQTAGINALWQFIASHELKGHGQILIDQFIHPPLYLLLLLTAGLMIQIEAHLALLPLDMSIIGTLTAEDAYHRLVQQMFRRMCRRKLFLIVLV